MGAANAVDRKYFIVTNGMDDEAEKVAGLEA